MHRYLPFLCILILACEPEAPGTDEPAVNFDRAAMLEHWADNLILPAFADFTEQTQQLRVAAESYTESPSDANLAAVRDAYVEGYLSWQTLSPWMIGPGEELRLRDQLNLYPTDTAAVLSDVDLNLDLPSSVDAQGFPALDFLLYRHPERANRVLQVSKRIDELASEAHRRWREGYRDEYVAATGNNATASIDRTVNDLIFYYEKHLRAGKVGIPAGVFSSQPLPHTVEAPYHGALSRRLFAQALFDFTETFASEPSLADYLDALGVEREGEPLSAQIKQNFNRAAELADALNKDFATQVRTDNTEMLRLYDALQANTILLKVDMLQALGINVDYVDADGD